MGNQGSLACRDRMDSRLVPLVSALPRVSPASPSVATFSVCDCKVTHGLPVVFIGFVSAQGNLGTPEEVTGLSSDVLYNSFLQGHPGKEGPPGTKGNQVRPSTLPFTL